MAKESQAVQIGISCADFSLPGTDGKIHSLKSYAEAKVLVIGFTCNHCPYVQAYEARMIAWAAAQKSKSVAFVCINANDAAGYPDDSFEKMVERSKRLEFNFDYLRDETQEVARALNAACTPEFYVYDEKRILRYHGRFDDSAKDPSAVKIRYVENAVNALLAGEMPHPTQTVATGCSIKWK